VNFTEGGKSPQSSDSPLSQPLLLVQEKRRRWRTAELEIASAEIWEPALIIDGEPEEKQWEVQNR